MPETIDSFAGRVSELLGVELGGRVNPYDSLYDDWGLDSLQAFQLIIVIEAIADVLVPPLETPELLTVQDAYGYYRSLLPTVGQ